MKLNITTTETRQSEIVIGFPTFTKIVKEYHTEYYAVLDEEKLIQVNEYSKILGSINQRENIKLAFEKGYVNITTEEFENAINNVNLATHKLTNKVLQDIAELEIENEYDRKQAIENDKVNEHCGQ